MHLPLRVKPKSFALKRECKRQIRDHLTNVPTSGDTLRGIIEWWLLKQEIAHNTAVVKEALEELIA